jgi:spore coat polysaccharide biosynthesis protein SpsF
MNRPVVGIIQARSGSSRLPGKMLLDLHGMPVIQWVWYRVRKARLLDEVIVAIPEGRADDALADLLESFGANFYRGNENDVLDRLLKAARSTGAHTVVRICADNPLVSGEEIDNLVSYFAANDLDYAYNHIPRNNLYPDGLGAEIASMAVIESIAQHVFTNNQREHVFNYIWENQDRFRIGTFNPPEEKNRHPELKLDLDTKSDYIYLRSLDVNRDMSARDIVAAALQKVSQQA